MIHASVGRQLSRQGSSLGLHGFRHPVLIAFAVVMVVIGVSITLAIHAGHGKIIEFEAVKIAEVAARQAVAARTVYSRDAVAKLKKDGTGSDVHSDNRPGYIPLPAQFLRLLGTEAKTASSGLYAIQLISRWNLSPEQDLRDPFQLQAWERLVEQERKLNGEIVQNWEPVWRIESLDGVRTLRFLRADPANAEGCVQCHNAYEMMPNVQAQRVAQGMAPGKQWKLGQLMGAIEVRVPLDRIEAISDAEIHKTIAIVVSIALAGFVVAAFFVLRDMRQKERLRRTLQVQANYDGLTGLVNRYRFSMRVDRLIAEMGPGKPGFAVLFIDVDRFKAINDSLGHAIGDQVLRQISIRLQNMLTPDDLVARYSGDEFIAMVRDVSDDTRFEARIQELLGILSAPIVIGEHHLYLTASIGISQYPRDGTTCADLVRSADAAMYRAKEIGRNTSARYEASIAESAIASLTLHGELQRAFEQNQFELHYQPRIDVASGRILAVEALVRWRHPVRGLVPPGAFLPEIDRRGMTWRLGQWVLAEALRQRRVWMREGYPNFRTAVNVSPLQFQSPDFVTEVSKALKDAGVPAELLELEITEGTLMHEPERVVQTLTELSRLGVRLALDDFGTGYSSLSYLKRFPIHTLKIDKSFVDGLPSDSNDRTLTQAIVGLSHSLNLQVVAEGVETRSQLEFLAQSGCQEVQGYFFARPAAAAQLADMLKSGMVSVGRAEKVVVSAAAPA